MPADRAKVLAALNEKFKGKSVDKNYKEGIATKWAAKITDDEAIDAFINDREEDVLEYMKAKDAAVTAATAKAKTDAAAAVTGKAEPEPEPETEMGKLMKMIGSLTEKVDGFEKAKQTETLSERFKNHEKIKGIPEALLKGYFPKTEEEFESAVETVQTQIKPFADKLGIAGYGAEAPAVGGVVKAVNGKVKEASDDAVKAVMSQL